MSEDELARADAQTLIEQGPEAMLDWDIARKTRAANFVREERQKAFEADVKRREAIDDEARRRREEVDKRTERMLAEAEEIAATKIDPDRRSVGARIVDALATFAYGLAAPGQPNLALQAIQRRIDQDIDAQKANLAQRRAG